MGFFACLSPIVNECEFRFWRLEKWWVAFYNYENYSPKGRIRLFGNWFWRK